ncbi:MAG: hypothetical protein KJS66_03275 [Acidobacteria bacterium]|nr:hypothetical protein [Acidobacteriota bacterium]
MRTARRRRISSTTCGGARYGEGLAVFLREDKLQAEVYGTKRAARC